MKKHALTTRIWHWANALAIVILFMSGLNISNAHRRLYWGDYGFDRADAWLEVIRFPAWATIPQRYDLAEARDWHNLSAWIFGLALLLMWVSMLANSHFRRDLTTRLAEWSPKSLWADIREHLRGHFEPADGSYNVLQRVTYGLVLGVGLPMMVFTGLAMSPGFEAAAPWFVDLLGGRQSARSIHFIVAWGLFAFFVVHIVMVLVSGPIRQIGSMITGGNRKEASS